MPTRRACCLIAASLLFLAIIDAGIGPTTTAIAAEIESFTPSVPSPALRQVSVRFSAPMVAFGDPALASPFSVQCAVAGNAHWIDTHTWVYDFERDLPGGTACTFALHDDVRTLAREAITGRRSYEVSSGAPAVVGSFPAEGSTSIEEEQVFLLALNGEADPASLREHVAFEVDGLPERIGIDLIDGEQRAALLEATPRWYRPSDDKLAVLVRARRAFPSGKAVRLVWGRGVRSPSGVATAVDRALGFQTREPFTVEPSCERENAKADCVPLTPISLGFSAAVPRQQASAITLTDTTGKSYAAAHSDGASDELYEVEFPGPFPESAALTLTLPASLRDVSGRSLPPDQASTIVVKTAPLPPLAKFAARFGIVEAKGDALLPVTLRNVEKELASKELRVSEDRDGGAGGLFVRLAGKLTGSSLRIPDDDPKAMLSWLRRVAIARRDESLFDAPPAAGGGEVRSFTLPRPGDDKEFEVVGVPFQAPGLYVVELASPRLGASLLGKDEPMYVPAAALVTNLSVHMKRGRESSLAWVTTLDRAAPVSAARVDVHDCNGTVLASATTDGQGIARLPALPGDNELPRCPNYPADVAEDRDQYHDIYSSPALSGLDSGLFVTARTADDISFVATSWDDGIETWRFGVPSDYWQAPYVVHTVLDRGLYRSGETVGMKHLLRARTLGGFAAVDAARRPKNAVIRHLGSDQSYTIPLSWDDNGVAAESWPIPASAKLGSYRIVMPDGDGEVDAGSFRIEQFRVPLMKADLSLPSRPQPGVVSLPIDVAVAYLAGGGAGGLAVTLRSQIRSGHIAAPTHLENFTFGNGPVSEGIVRGDQNEDEAKPVIHQRREVTLDAGGGARSQASDLPRVATLSELLVEAEFRDPNGEIQTVATTAQLWPAALLPGISVEDWAGSTGHLKTHVAVLDRNGQPAAGAAVRVDVYQRTMYSHRKRLIGGFYAYDNSSETTKAAAFCEGRTDARGILDCDIVARVKGQVLLQASVTDPVGLKATAHTEAWVSGEDSGFAVGNDERIDLIPEKPSYEPGETARFQVRMPFQHATALVTVDREGVGEAQVVQLDAKHPVIEVNVLGSYAPNVFVSALVVRGRVGDVQPTALIDLGRPAYKLGLAEIRVGHGAHELAVTVAPERESYHVRDKAAVRISVRGPGGRALPPGSEVAVAAVDEGLLELSANKSWDLLAAMMGRRGDDVETSTAQGQVIGKRHYGRKALPIGGGGGRQATRELFDTLLLWNPHVALDANGSATVEVPLNDSVTAFRIEAIANAGQDLFGSGFASIRATQELTLMAGLPPLVRNGDRLSADVTVRNAAAAAMRVRVGASVEGLGETLAAQDVELKAGESRTVSWPVVVPHGVSQLRYVIDAKAQTGQSDRLAVTQRVLPAVPVRTVQATLAAYDGPLREPIDRPAAAEPGRGGIEVRLASSLAGGGQGGGEGADGPAQQWLREYRYSCLEQKTSVAIGLRDDARWQTVADSLDALQDDDGLLKYFPSMQRGSDILTAYVLTIADAAGRQLPDPVRQRMIAGLRAFVAGSIGARDRSTTGLDLPLRKLAAIAALGRAGAAEPAMLGSLTIEPELWPTSALLDWWSILSDVKDIPDHDAKRNAVDSLLRSRLDLSGTTLVLSASPSDDLWWLMTSSETNSARLLHFLVRQRLWSKDLPRLAQGLMAQRHQGAWSTTIANAWAIVALEAFSRAFETEPVGGSTDVVLGESRQSANWKDGTPPALAFPWPPAASQLEVTHSGSGKPWVTVVSRAAIAVTEAQQNGYRITRTVTAAEPRVAGSFSRGDRVHVRLDIEAQRDMTWVVVDDPLPGGASALGRGLARDSRIDDEAGEPGSAAFDNDDADDVDAPTFVERAADSYRAYFEDFPKGHHRIEYDLRLNQNGHFHLPPSRVEALYAPEVFGEVPNADVEVEP